ncbi:MAG: aldose 1-epimerase family protein [Candidatus Eremiobacteraeota bacterium]|nr:aldose 1-epimerase family protein [Candidatus Eremiobacteraeota bacterium]
MPRLFGREYSACELNARIGRPEQIGGIREFEFSDGRAKGMRAFEIRSGAGLSVTCVADRALDVCAAEFRGIPLVWHGPGGLASPEYYQPRGDDFARNFFGGLFTTCGLASFGPPGHDVYGSFGMHGRINHLPAEELCARTVWEDERCFFEIVGIVSEAQMFGENLRLERRLRVELGSNALELRDVVTNEGGTRTPHMLLYHCNMGFPLLDEHAELSISQAAMQPRDDEAKRGLPVWNRGGEPDPTFAEQVFIHEPIAGTDGLAHAVMLNRSLDDGRGIALSIAFNPAQLPALFTWRMLGVKTYVMGIEPANCPTIAGRVEAGKIGTLPFLEPGESRVYELRFDALGGKADIEQALARTGHGNGTALTTL